jgi:hypothetical protein
MPSLREELAKAVEQVEELEGEFNQARFFMAHAQIRRCVQGVNALDSTQSKPYLNAARRQIEDLSARAAAAKPEEVWTP